MTINARQHNMVKLIKSKERVSVKKLAETFYVSEMTVHHNNIIRTLFVRDNSKAP